MTTKEVILTILDSKVNDIKTAINSADKTELNNILKLLNDVDISNAAYTPTTALSIPSAPSIDSNIENIDDITSHTPTGTSTGTSTVTDITTIQTRLNNCQALEILYLHKHNEVIRIFEFAKLLFTKYKYAITLILYLIKFINSPTLTSTTSPTSSVPTLTTVKLPEPIITNIGKLIADQKKMKDIIDNMDTSLSQIGSTSETIKKSVNLINP